MNLVSALRSHWRAIGESIEDPAKALRRPTGATESPWRPANEGGWRTGAARRLGEEQTFNTSCNDELALPLDIKSR
ncbi:hypothetical protein AAE478_007779 [Parahypoxylon ruwenzoriense]